MPCTPLGRVVIGHGDGFGGDEIPGVRMDVVGDGGWWGKDESWLVHDDDGKSQGAHSAFTGAVPGGRDALIVEV